MAARDRGEAPDCRARALLRARLGGDEEAVCAAMSTYQGSYASLAAHVRAELDELLPPYLAWLVEFVTLDAIAGEWLTRGRSWTLPDCRTRGVHVFVGRRPRALDDEP